MSRGEDQARWLSLVSLQEEVEHSEVVVPQIASRIDGRPKPPSQRALAFAEDLAFADSWARISAAKRRAA